MLHRDCLRYRLRPRSKNPRQGTVTDMQILPTHSSSHGPRSKNPRQGTVTDQHSAVSSDAVTRTKIKKSPSGDCDINVQRRHSCPIVRTKIKKSPSGDCDSIRSLTQRLSHGPRSKNPRQGTVTQYQCWSAACSIDQDQKIPVRGL